LLVRPSAKGLRVNLTRSSTKALQYAAKSMIQHCEPVSDIWIHNRKQIAPPKRAEAGHTTALQLRASTTASRATSTGHPAR
jgi:hypothetical protein